MNALARHPVWSIGGGPPWIWSAQGPEGRFRAGTYGATHGYNPIAIGDFSSWWAIPCNRTMVLAGVAAAAASGLATVMLRKDEKKKKRAGR